MARGIFHLPGSKKHVENSFRGIHKAKRQGKAWIDLDLTMTRDGVVVCNHWPRPLLRDGFRDPQRKIRRTAKISSLTWAEVQRLRTRDGYHIRSLDQMLKVCAQDGVGAVLEPKGDPRFRSLLVWRNVAAMAHRHKAKVRGYTLRRNAGVLPFMNQAGIRSHRLSH